MSDVKNNDPIPNGALKQSTASPESSLEIPFWRRMLGFFLFVFLGILCTNAVYRLHEIGEPVFGLTREPFFVAVITTALVGITDWVRINKR